MILIYKNFYLLLQESKHLKALKEDMKDKLFTIKKYLKLSHVYIWGMNMQDLKNYRNILNPYLWELNHI